MMVRGLLLRAGLRQMEVKVSSAHRGRFRNEFGAKQSAQLHQLFYRSCCIASCSASESRSVSANADASAFSHSVINFYHLSDVAQPEEAASKHKETIKDKGWDICGRIYISYQGINAQFSGPWKDALEYTKWVASQPEFNDLSWREYPVPKHMFPKLKLKFRPNLISLQGGMDNLPVTDHSSRATPVSPSDWKQMLRDAQSLHTASPSPTSQSNSCTSTNDPQLATQTQSQATSAAAQTEDSKSAEAESKADAATGTQPVVLDVRNAYEWDAGHFEGAQRPLEDAFNETPRETDSGEAALPDALKGASPDTPVMMYCTGGIRCDVYSTFLRQQGFDNLYTLEGGIQNYLEEESSEHWKGSLFVFDDRMAVAPSHLRLARESQAAAVEARADGNQEQAASTAASQATYDAEDRPQTSSELAASEITEHSDTSSESSEFEKPKAAVPCVLCGGEPELPHINCANVDCNVLLLICDSCRNELQGCCSEECRDHAPRMVRPIKDGAYRGMLNYTPKQYGARQRLSTPQRLSKLAEARDRRRARIKARQEEKILAKQQRKQLARLAMEAREAVQKSENNLEESRSSSIASSKSGAPVPASASTPVSTS